MADIEQCHLLRLPQELRNIIYSYLIIVTTLSQPKPIVTIGDQFGEATIRVRHLRNAALLRTCRQLYGEIRDINSRIMETSFTAQRKWHPEFFLESAIDVPHKAEILSQVQRARVVLPLQCIAINVALYGGERRGASSRPRIEAYYSSGTIELRRKILIHICEQIVPNAKNVTVVLDIDNGNAIESELNGEDTIILRDPMQSALSVGSFVDFAALPLKTGVTLDLSFRFSVPACLEISPAGHVAHASARTGSAWEKYRLAGKARASAERVEWGLIPLPDGQQGDKVFPGFRLEFCGLYSTRKT